MKRIISFLCDLGKKYILFTSFSVFVEFVQLIRDCMVVVLINLKRMQNEDIVAWVQAMKKHLGKWICLDGQLQMKQK